MILAYYEGLLTQARIQNDVEVLRDTIQWNVCDSGGERRARPWPPKIFLIIYLTKQTTTKKERNMNTNQGVKRERRSNSCECLHRILPEIGGAN